MLRKLVSCAVIIAFVSACGGPPRIQTSLQGHPKYTGLEHWVPIPGTENVDKRDSTITMAPEEFVVDDEKARPESWGYADITDASYSYSKHPRWGLASGLAFFICLPCMAFAFLKKKNHWLALETPDGPQLFKLHKNNYTQIIAGFEAQGIEIERITDE